MLYESKKIFCHVALMTLHTPDDWIASGEGEQKNLYTTSQ